MEPWNAAKAAVLDVSWPILSDDTVRWLWLPLAIALATIVVTIQVNHHVRLYRLKRISSFSATFSMSGMPKKRGRSAKGPLPPGRDISESPSFEFVATKYVADLDEVLEEEEFTRLKDLVTNGDDESRVEYIVHGIRCFQMPSNRMKLYCAAPLAAAVMAGWSLILAPDILVKFLAPGHLADCRNLCRFSPSAMSVAFLGAYISALTILVRAVCLFDLAPTTFMRCTLHVVGSVTAAFVLWNVLISMADSGTCAACSKLEGLAYPFLFVVGFVPDAGLQYVVSSFANAFSSPVGLSAQTGKTESQGRIRGFVSGLLSYIKVTDGRFAGATQSTPLDVIDGIDFFTRFRLVEAGLNEVQNLAVANPILLHVETPFGIYQTIDWVGQAQLCTVVGPERFLILRQLNIRTVFDLERAILSVKSTRQLRRIVGGILLMTTETMRRVQKLGRSSFPNMSGTAATSISAEDYGAWVVTSAQERATFRVRLAKDPGIAARPPTTHRVWVTSRIKGFTPIATFDVQGETATQSYEVFETSDDDATIKHMVRVIMDDLHVMRLRQIWESVARRLGADAATLDDSEDAFLGG